MQNVLEHGPVLRGQLVDGLRRLGLGDGLGFHPQGVAGPGDARADDGAAVPADGDGWEATGKLTFLHDLGDHTHRGEAPLNVGHQEQAPAGGAGRIDCGAGLVRLERHGEDHAGQHHPGSQGQQWECDVLVRHRILQGFTLI